MKRRLLSLVCALAILLGMLTVPTFAATESTSGAAVCGEKNYSSLQAAVDDYTFGIIVLQEDAQKVDIPLNVYLDLNGHNVADVTVSDGATLYVSDSQTDDYTVADGICGAVTEIAGNVQAAEGYLAVTEEDAVSFHRVDLSIRSMSLRPGNAGVYYTSSFAADEVVAARVESYGVALSVAAEPTAENLETLCGYSVLYDFAAGEKSGTLLTGIMSEENTDEENAAYAAMDVYGRAYVKTEDGYAFGAVAVRDLQEQVEAIDGIFAQLTETQKSGILAMYDSYKAAMADWNIPNIRGEQMGETVITVPVQAENNVVTEEITVEKDGMSITIPFGALLETGAAELTLNVTKKEKSDSGIEAAEDQQLLPFDVHVEGLSAENTVPLTVALGKVMPENLNMGNYSAFHVEKNGTNKMELIPLDAEFTAHNQFKYTLDGEIILYVATFSEMTLAANLENVWAGETATSFAGGTGSAEDPYLIRNADQLAYLNALISADNEDYTGKSYKLLADIDFGGVENAEVEGNVWYPIGYWNLAKNEDGDLLTNSADENYYTYGGAFQGVFDGNGNTIANIYQSTWIMTGNYDGPHWDEAMGLFGYVYGGTVKNLTMQNFQNDGEFTPTGCVTAYAAGSETANAVFENIALVDCNPRVYNTGNGGIVGIGGNTNDQDLYDEETKTGTGYALEFSNITIDNSNKITALWGSWDVACGGLIGMFRGAGNVFMTNCHVAAQIDVYNDVCGNYQYYWYRYSGMLIGTNKTMVTDSNGYTVPETSKYHATGCTVHFGDWNNYYYCELVANSLASYTHDHQFSRLTEVDSIDVEAMTVTVDGKTTEIPTSGWAHYVVVNGEHSTENATCYHFNKGIAHNHKDYNGDGAEDKETVGGVEMYVENNEHIFLPFNQLFTGYGWGVKHIPVYNGEDYAFKGVTILDRLPSSNEKFEVHPETETVYATDTTVTIGELFAAISGKENEIQQGKVQVTVSPVDSEDTTNTVSGIYTPNAEDWTQGTLTFSGLGKAKITITDYFFCTPTVLEIDIAEICEHCNKPVADWKPLTLSAKSVKYSTNGHYYLTKTFNASAGSSVNNLLWITATDFVIDLRGNSINNGVGRVFYVEKSDAMCSVLDTVGGAQLTAKYTAGGGVGYTIGTLNIYGGNWQNNGSSSIGGAIYVLRGRLNIYGGTLNGTNKVSKGGAIYVNGGHVTIYGGTILGGTASDNGDCIYMQKNTSTSAGILEGKLDIRGGTIEGQIYVKSNATLKISGNPEITDLDVIGTDLPTIGELTEGASIAITAENVGDTVSEELTVDNYEQYGKYFHATMDGCDVIVDGNVLKVTDDVCVHCDTANTEIDWKNLTQDTLTTLRKRCTNKTYYYLPTGHYKLYAEETQEERIINLTQQLMIGDYGGTATGDVAFDLNGATMKATSNNRAMLMSNASTLSVMDTSSENPEDWGAIIGGYISASGASIYAGEGSTINLYSGIIKWERKEGTTDVPHSGTIDAKGTVINLYGGILGGTDVRGYGGTIYAVEDSEINLYEGATIQAGTSGTVNGVSNTSAGKGGTIYLKESKLNVYGGTIEEGSSLRGGDTIYALTSSTTNFLGGTVHGQIYLGSTTTVNLAGAPVLEHLEMQEGTKVTIGELTADANITVNATGAFTDTLTNADAVQSYIDNGYIKAHSSLDGKVLAIVDGVLTVTDAHVVEEPEETVPEE